MTDDDTIKRLASQARAIDEHYASRLAFMLECLIVDYHGHWEAACALLDEYKAEWEKVNPSPPTFMGEPVPDDRRERLAMMASKRKEGDHEQRPHQPHRSGAGSRARLLQRDCNPTRSAL